MNRSGLKTLLLGLVVVIVISTIFVGLPVRLPPWHEMSCDRVAFSCGREVEDRFYATLIWDSPEIPDDEELADRFMELLGRFETYGIPFYGAFRYNMEYSEDGSSLTVSGYLHYGLKKEASNGIPYTIWYGGFVRQELRVNIEEFYDEGDSKIRNYHIMTDEEGYFETTIQLDAARECFELLVLYEGKNIVPDNPRSSAQYYALTGGIETECEYEQIRAAENHFWWIWLLGVLALGMIGYIMYRVIKRNRVSFGEDVPGVEEIDFSIQEEQREPEAGGDILRVAIQFPDIELYLPSVWGVTDDIEVAVQLRDEQSETESDTDCRIDTGDNTHLTEKTDSNGMVHFHHTYEVTGSYRVMGDYQDSRSGDTVSGWRRLRIVDYREEMVRIFNDLIYRLNLSEIDITPEMTPRETERRLASRIDGITRDTIKRIVDGFEEANYSTHPVERTRYIRMYTAIQEVLTNGRRSKQDD